MRRAPALRPAPPVPPVAPPTDGAGGDLYRLYVRAAGALRARALTELSPGPLREETVRACRPLPREHYEAKFERIAGDPAAVAAHRRELLRVIAAG